MDTNKHIGAILFGVLIGIHSLCAQSTEGPSTAPRGGLLVEIDVVVFSIDRNTPANDGVHIHSTTAGAVMLSTGLTDHLDMQVGFETWREESIIFNGTKSVNSGQGDGWLRMKWNFSGNAEEGRAWALLPYLKLPLATEGIGNNEVEPGVVLLFAQPWGDEANWQFNAGFIAVDNGGGGHDTVVSASTAFTHNLNTMHAIYYELLYSIDLSSRSDSTGEAGMGWTYAINDRGWIDVGLYVGLNKAAPDFTPLLRFGWQF